MNIFALPKRFLVQSTGTYSANAKPNLMGFVVVAPLHRWLHGATGTMPYFHGGTSEVLQPRASALDEPLPHGSTARGRAPSSCTRLPVVYASEHLLVVDKPADMRMSGAAFTSTVESLAQKQISERGSALAERVQPTGWHRVGHLRAPLPPPKIRMIHQLDYATSGVLLLGLQRRATAQITAAFRKREIRKRYLAIVHGHVVPGDANAHFWIDAPLVEYADDFRVRLATVDDHTAHASTEDSRNSSDTGEIKRDPGCACRAGSVSRTSSTGIRGFAESRVTDSYCAVPECDGDRHHADAVKLRPCRQLQPAPTATTKKIFSALTLGTVLGIGSYQGLPASLLELRPVTGRRHQLRVHLWCVGHGIVGDATYPTLPDEDERFSRMMLHAAELELPAYLQHRLQLPGRFVAPTPPAMAAFQGAVLKSSSSDVWDHETEGKLGHHL
jgi:23S rRNA-/tRNA-specific pseudouridylate synthase